MGYALRLQGGTTQHVVIPAQRSMSGPFAYSYKFKSSAGNLGGSFFQILGLASTSRNMCQFADSSLPETTTLVHRARAVSSQINAPISITVEHEVRYEFDGVDQLKLYVDGELLNTFTGANRGFDTDIIYIGRHNNSYTPSGYDLLIYDINFEYGFTYNGKFDPSLSNGTGLTLINSSGSNHGTLVGFTGDDSQWVYYDSGTAQPSYPVELSGAASLQLLSEKVGHAAALVTGTAALQLPAAKVGHSAIANYAAAAAAANAEKVAQSLLAVSASSAANLTASKVGFATASLIASADINLIAGNVVVVEASINFTAAAGIALAAEKRAVSTLAFLSAASIQLSERKVGNAIVSLTAGNLASLATEKHGIGAASLQCAVASSFISSKTSYNSFTVPVSINITLSGLNAATKPVARAVYLNTSSYRNRLLVTSSEQKQHIANHSRQRYNLQTGGINA